MTGVPPRLAPSEVLAVLDQMLLDAEAVPGMTAWRHTAVCGGITPGIWNPDAVCSTCRFQVSYRSHIDQFLLVPVPDDEQATRAT